MRIRPAIGLRAFAVFALYGALCRAQPAADATAERARGILEQAVVNKNPDTRLQAVYAVSLLGAHENAIPRLATILDQDKDVPVRLAVVVCLSDFNDPAVIPILKKALQDPVPEVDFAAAKALFHLKQPIGKQVLLGMLSGEEKASSSFMSSQTRKAFRMIHTPTKLFMTAAAVAVPVPGFGFGVASVEGILADPGASARAAVVLMLQGQKDAATRDAIQAALHDNDWSVRAAAAHAVAMWNDPALKQELVPLFDDKKGAVAFRAAAGYLRLSRLQKR